MKNNLNDSNSDIEYLTACPGCGLKNITVLELPNEHKVFLTSSEEMLITSGVCGCEDCGLTFLSPRMTQKKLIEYYSKQSRIPRDSILPDSPFAKLMEMQIDLIEKFKRINVGMNILEIGCAEGFFLKSFSGRFNNKLNVYGVELSEKYIEQAKKNLPEIVLYETTFERTDFGETKFDVIVMRHVLEHLGNPSDCLNKIRSILAPNGVLYIEVPDSQNITPALSRFYHDEHLLYFTSQTLMSYLKAFCFQPFICERFEANPVGSGFSYPVLRALSELGQEEKLGSFPGYAKQIYTDNKRRNDTKIDLMFSHIHQRLRELTASQKSIGLFGAGPHTMDVLSLFARENFQWSKIFDNNPNKHGKTMCGIPIVKPDQEVLKSVDCILISSAEFEREIVEQIRFLIGKQVEVITIYGSDSSN